MALLTVGPGVAPRPEIVLSEEVLGHAVVEPTQLARAEYGVPVSELA